MRNLYPQLTQNRIRIFNGARVTCPNCSALIAIAKRTIMINLGLDPDDFSFTQKGQTLEDPAACLDCGSYFLKNGKLHLDGGWS